MKCFSIMRRPSIERRPCEPECDWLRPGQPRGQSLDALVDSLVGVGAIKVFMEHASARRRHGRVGRTVWNTCLVVTDLTRLGNSTADLSDIVTVLGRRGMGFG